MRDLVSVLTTSVLRSFVFAGLSVVLATAVWAASPAGEPIWRAFGHEPSWAVTRTDHSFILETDFGATRREFPLPEAKRLDGQTVSYSTRADTSTLQLTVKEAVCIDTMTGMPRPEQVTVQVDDRQFTGCGGDPAALLRTHAWKVTHIAGRPVLADPVIDVTFSGDGRVSGLASCNRYGAGYTVTGEGLKIEKGFSSMMACEPPLMQQEQEFLRLLEGVARFSITPAGGLVLHTNGNETIELVKL